MNSNWPQGATAACDLIVAAISIPAGIMEAAPSIKPNPNVIKLDKLIEK